MIFITQLHELCVIPRFIRAIAPVVAAGLLAAPTWCQSLPLDHQVMALARDVNEGLRGKPVEKLAVVEFASIDGTKLAEMKYLTDQFTMHLVQQPRVFALIERRDLSTIRGEAAGQTALLEDALLDRAKMTERSVAGVDAILVGMLASLESGAELTIKVLDVKTASIHFAVARTVDLPSFANDPAVRAQSKGSGKQSRADKSKDAEVPEPKTTPVVALAQRTAEGLRGKVARKLAVAEFAFSDGMRTLETKYITDQFTTRLFLQAIPFKLVGRGDLDAILAAYSLEEGIAREIVEEASRRSTADRTLESGTMTRLSIEGVDAVLIGTVVKLAHESELYIKVLDVKSAAIHAADKCRIDIPRFAGQGPRIGIETPAQRKLREDATKAEKERQRSERQHQQALSRAAISGCESGTVVVNPRATDSRPWYLQTASIRIRILNLHSSAVNISDEDGELVQNLCSGGSITISRSCPLLSSGAVRYAYVATGRFADGSLGTDRSRTMYINPRRPAQETVTWEIRLRRTR